VRKQEVKIRILLVIERSWPGITPGCPSSGTFLALKMGIAMHVLVECKCIAKFFVEHIQRHGNKEQSNQPHQPF
jgi:hypothetical protein